MLKDGTFYTALKLACQSLGIGSQFAYFPQDIPYLIFGTTSYDQKPLSEPSFTYLSEPEEFSLAANKDRIDLQWQLPDFDLDACMQHNR